LPVGRVRQKKQGKNKLPRRLEQEEGAAVKKLNENLLKSHE
jgi:hypothetical protein